MREIKGKKGEIDVDFYDEGWWKRLETIDLKDGKRKIFPSSGERQEGGGERDKEERREGDADYDDGCGERKMEWIDLKMIA